MIHDIQQVACNIGNMFSRKLNKYLEKITNIYDDDKKKLYKCKAQNAHELTSGQKKRLDDMLKWYEDNVNPLLPAKDGYCTINTKEGPYVAQKAYKQSYDKEKKTEKLIDEMILRGYARRSQGSSNASPLILVEKKTDINLMDLTPEELEKIRQSVDGTRLVVDYRQLNEITYPDAHPLRHGRNLLTQIGRSLSNCFTVMDLKSGFMQLKVVEEDIHKTAFISHHGLWEFLRMPFGLRNAPAQFQRYVEAKFADIIKDGHVLIYIDDLIIYTPDIESHFRELQRVLDRMVENNIIIKTTKCVFFQKKVNYLGHQISRDGLEPKESNIEVIKKLTPPTNLVELQAFFGLLNYYLDFIFNFVPRTKTMRQLLKKDVEWQWTKQCQEEFDTIINEMVQGPLLKFPEGNKPFNLYTDASDYGVGYVLTQGKGTEENIIKMGSKSLTSGERNASTIDRELIGMLEAVRGCFYYIDGREFTIYTDHKPLTFALKEKPCNARNARVIEMLLQHNVKIKYIPGKTNKLADALSRLVPKNPKLYEEVKIRQLNKCSHPIKNHLQQGRDVYTNTTNDFIKLYIKKGMEIPPLTTKIVNVFKRIKIGKDQELNFQELKDDRLTFTSCPLSHGLSWNLLIKNEMTWPVNLFSEREIGRIMISKKT